jgi:hypothetical protein
MRFPRLTSRHWMVIGALVVLYCVGYAWARSERILIHRSSFATDGGSRRYFHRVEAGDFGPGLLQGAETPFIIRGCYVLFTPLRWLESVVWSFIPQHENAA